MKLYKQKLEFKHPSFRLHENLYIKIKAFTDLNFLEIEGELLTWFVNQQRGYTLHNQPLYQ